jgi:topoisomerase-4 subunit B
MAENNYDESSIRSLDWKEHIRLRPGMYIGKLGDGSAPDDGIYVLLKEVMDNCIDEYAMGYGKSVEVSIDNGKVAVRDYGRGIPLGKVVDVVSKINTGAKYDSKAFQKAVGLNGVGTKAVNALSSYFKVTAVREGEQKTAEFERGVLTGEMPVEPTEAKNGTYVLFEPDSTVFKNYHYIGQYVENMIWNYCYLNSGLSIYLNRKKFYSANGLLDLLLRKTDESALRYPIIHLKGDDIEMALTHGNQYGEEYYSFVNGQNTTQGGTHLSAFKEAIVKTVRDHYGKDYASEDVRQSIIGAIAVRIQEPVFESQTKTKLGSNNISLDENALTVRTFVNDFVKEKLDNYLHMHPEIKDALKRRIEQSERERKELAGVKKIANERAKNLTDEKFEGKLDTMLFITEGDSASGSITKARSPETQAVFSLRGKPLNCFGLSKKVVYENEEFNLLQHALDIENGIETLRYNQIIIATDADVDGSHIRLLMLTFFLQFFPDLVREGHLFILQTPLFRVRNKKETIYCYTEEEKRAAITKLGGKPEITRFKGLGEISPHEFEGFISKDIKLDPVILEKESTIPKILSYYMGKNTPERQGFIIDNLIVEQDIVEEKVVEIVEES